MLMILLISGVIMPAFVWLLLYLNITNMSIKTEDGETIIMETKVEAQQYVFRLTVRSPFFWIYLLYSLCCIFAGVCSINVFGLGDWYFSL